MPLLLRRRTLAAAACRHGLLAAGYYYFSAFSSSSFSLFWFFARRRFASGATYQGQNQSVPGHHSLLHHAMFLDETDRGRAEAGRQAEMEAGRQRQMSHRCLGGCHIQFSHTQCHCRHMPGHTATYFNHAQGFAFFFLKAAIVIAATYINHVPSRPRRE